MREKLTNLELTNIRNNIQYLPKVWITDYLSHKEYNLTEEEYRFLQNRLVNEVGL